MNKKNAINLDQVAAWQISQAIQLYRSNTLPGFVCATTLAGAAEEILGDLCKENNIDNALNLLLQYAQKQFPQFSEKVLRERVFNLPRNIYKHLNEDLCEEEFDPQLAAWTMISRSIYNFCKLKFKPTNEFASFLDLRPECLANDDFATSRLRCEIKTETA